MCSNGASDSNCHFLLLPVGIVNIDSSGKYFEKEKQGGRVGLGVF